MRVKTNVHVGAVDIGGMFNERLPTSFAMRADAVRQLGGRYQFNITGEGGGQWFVDASAPQVIPGNPGNADVTISVASQDFQKLLENPLANVNPLFFSGKLKLSGDTRQGLNIGKLLTL